MLSCFILGGIEGVHHGNVSVENNTNHLLFHNANGPIVMHNGGSRYTAPA